MSRMHRLDWLRAIAFLRKLGKSLGRSPQHSRFKRLRCEQLEDRRMLAVFTVSNLNDSGPGSLRDAIVQANTFLSPDEIKFSVTGTIALTSGQIQVSDTLTISGPGQDALIIDAQQNSRLFLSSAPNFTLTGLTLTGGKTTGSASANRGGAIRSVSSGALTITASTLIGNHTEGFRGTGGAIYVSGALLTIDQSTIQGNYTKGVTGIGGAIRTESATITASSLIENWTEGSDSNGGAVFAYGVLMLENSTVSGNWTQGFDSKGGALLGSGGIFLNQSTISGNYTLGDFASGGGIFSNGISALQSTVTDNHTLHPNVYGGGIANNTGNITITNSILAGNTSQTTSPDLAPGTGTVVVNYSLIGDTTGSSITMASGTGNKLNQPALLGPLTDLGGPTLTHGPLLGSPVIDMGDPTPPSPPTFDQRGTPFDRIVGLRIDIGAVEDQPIPASADFDSDNDVDGRDFLIWQRGFGTPQPTAVKQDGDADYDYDVDGDDLAVWQLQYGTVPPLVEAIESGVL